MIMWVMVTESSTYSNNVFCARCVLFHMREPFEFYALFHRREPCECQDRGLTLGSMRG